MSKPTAPPCWRRWRAWTGSAFLRKRPPQNSFQPPKLIIYVKGGDYTLDTLNQDERRVVESAGGRIVILPFVPGKSTTALMEKILRL